MEPEDVKETEVEGLSSCSTHLVLPGVPPLGQLPIASSEKHVVIDRNISMHPERFRGLGRNPLELHKRRYDHVLCANGYRTFSVPGDRMSHKFVLWEHPLSPSLGAEASIMDKKNQICPFAVTALPKKIFGFFGWAFANKLVQPEFYGHAAGVTNVGPSAGIMGLLPVREARKCLDDLDALPIIRKGTESV